MNTQLQIENLKSRLDGLLGRRCADFLTDADHAEWSPKSIAQRGFDLIQIAIVVGVIGILLAGAFLGVPAVMAGVRANAEAQDLSAYMVAQQGLVEQGPIDNKSVTDRRLYNVDQTNGAIISNRFGGKVTIVGADGAPEITITSEAVPARACEKLVPNVANLFDKITVGTTVVRDIATVTTGDKKKTVLDRAALITACNVGGPVKITYVGNR